MQFYDFYYSNWWRKRKKIASKSKEKNVNYVNNTHCSKVLIVTRFYDKILSDFVAFFDLPEKCCASYKTHFVHPLMLILKYFFNIFYTQWLWNKNCIVDSNWFSASKYLKINNFTFLCTQLRELPIIAVIYVIKSYSLRARIK